MQILDDSTMNDTDSPVVVASIDTDTPDMDTADTATVDSDTPTLLSLDEYHLLVKKLADRVDVLEKTNEKISTEHLSACRKLRVQHRVIDHLRGRLDIVTGLEIPVDEAQGILPLRARRKVSRSVSLGRAVMRLQIDRSARPADSEPDENIPAIDPAEFLPIDDTMFDSIWLRRVREIARRCRVVTSNSLLSLDHHFLGLGDRARTTPQ